MADVSEGSQVSTLKGDYMRPLRRQATGYQQMLQRLPVQWRVIRALMIRELMERYGRRNLGFLWLIGEPLILIFGVIILWSVRDDGHGGHGVSMVSFALTGYSMLTLWRHVAQRGQGGLKGNIGLRFHQNVKTLDVLIAQAATEILGCALSFIIAYVILLITGFVDPIYDPILLVYAWILFGFFSFGVMLVIASICEMVDVAEKFVQPLMYLCLPVMGVFTMTAWLPQSYRDVIVWVPMANGVEMFRAAFYGPKYTFFYDVSYLLGWGFGCWAIGLALVARAERRLEA